MKIALINGQNHKGLTYHVGRMLALKIANDDEITEVFLPKDMPEFCCGCINCFSKSETVCPALSLDETYYRFNRRIRLAYFYKPSLYASMKALLDHYGYRFMVHRPEEKMFSKQVVCIATAAGGGMKSTCKVIKDSMFFWGVAKTYTYGWRLGLCYGMLLHKRKSRK